MISLDIAFDLDGVLADFFKSLWKQYGDKYGIYYDDIIMTKPDLHSVFPAVVAELMYDIFNAPGFYANLEPYPGAIEVLNMLHNTGHKVYFCTSPSNRDIPGTNLRAINPHSASGKIDWINKYVPHLGRNVTITKDKWRFKADVLVEDTPEKLAPWCEAHPNGLGILIDRPWNRYFTESESKIPAIHRTVLDYVPELIRRWTLRGEHQASSGIQA